MDGGKDIGPAVFTQILRRQLHVSKEQFWNTIDTGQPVDRPTDTDEPPPEYPAWILVGLMKHGYSEDDIRAMTPEEAEALLYEKWSSP